jgi:hypothetical protein
MYLGISAMTMNEKAKMCHILLFIFPSILAVIIGRLSTIKGWRQVIPLFSKKCTCRHDSGHLLIDKSIGTSSPYKEIGEE